MDNLNDKKGFLFLHALFNRMKSHSVIKTLLGRLPEHILTICCIFSATFLFAAPLYASNNILLIIADDFGVDSHGLYGVGSSVAPTPTIDSLAEQGVRFDRVWSNPNCSPTRATILTGRYSFRTGVGDPVQSYTINPDEYTVADALKAMGYSTAQIGKWHLGTTNSRPDKLGFDYYASYIQGKLPDYFNWRKLENGVASTVTNYATTENVNDAISWISDQSVSNPDKPWFMWLAFNAPHDPFHKPPNDLHSYDDLSNTATDIEENPVPYYQAMVEAMDTEINRLLTVIDRENTTIIFVGDNGTPSQVVVPPAVSSRVKGTLFEGGVWVPLIISDPRSVQNNVANGALVNTVDIFSTIIEMAGGDVAALVAEGVSIDSASMISLLNDPSLNMHCQYILAEWFRDIPNNNTGKTIRNDHYKLIRFDLRDEIFHELSNDPSFYPTDELDNLLDGNLTSVEQSNYDALSDKLNSLLSGNDTDRVCFVDSDSDGVPDAIDAFPLDPNESIDTDNDGVGNNADSDDDGDGLLDVNETNTGVYVSPTDTGTDPLIADTDGDGFDDGLEIEFGSDPVSNTSFPAPDGDLAPLGNPDGVINAGDVLIATRITLGVLAPSTLEIAHGDMNADGVINISDLIVITNYVLNR